MSAQGMYVCVNSALLLLMLSLYLLILMEGMCQNYSTGNFTSSIDSKKGKGLFWNYPGYKDQVTQREEGINQLHPQFLQGK